MKHISILLGAFLMLAPTQNTFAQDNAEHQTDSSAWHQKLSIGLGGSQAAYSNWQEGGISSLSLTGNIKFGAVRETEKSKQSHNLHINYGLIKLDTLDIRKAVDEVKYNFEFLWKTDLFVDPTITADLRTQLTPSYKYDAAEPVKISDLFAPAVFNQAIGGTYSPAKWFKTFLGVGAQESIVTIDSLQTSFGHDEGQTVKFEGGLDWRTQFDKELFKNVTLHSKLHVFASFESIGEPDIRWENSLELKVNDWLNANMEFTTFYDKDVLDKIQIKEILSIGLNFSLL